MGLEDHDSCEKENKFSHYSDEWPRSRVLTLVIDNRPLMHDIRGHFPSATSSLHFFLFIYQRGEVNWPLVCSKNIGRISPKSSHTYLRIDDSKYYFGNTIGCCSPQIGYRFGLFNHLDVFVFYLPPFLGIEEDKEELPEYDFGIAKWIWTPFSTPRIPISIGNGLVACCNDFVWGHPRPTNAAAAMTKSSHILQISSHDYFDANQDWELEELQWRNCFWLCGFYFFAPQKKSLLRLMPSMPQARHNFA